MTHWIQLPHVHAGIWRVYNDNCSQPAVFLQNATSLPWNKYCEMKTRPSLCDGINTSARISADTFQAMCNDISRSLLAVYVIAATVFSGLAVVIALVARSISTDAVTFKIATLTISCLSLSALFGVLAHAEWIPHQTDEMHGRTLTLFLIGTYFSIALSLSLLTTLMWTGLCVIETERFAKPKGVFFVDFSHGKKFKPMHTPAQHSQSIDRNIYSPENWSMVA